MMMWQPIETAPKRDDVQILTFHADFAPKHGRNKLQKESCYWYQTSFWSEKFGLFVGWPLNIQPTHWMELPAPPLPAQDWKKEPEYVPPLVEWAKGLQSNAERVPDNAVGICELMNFAAEFIAAAPAIHEGGEHA